MLTACCETTLISDVNDSETSRGDGVTTLKNTLLNGIVLQARLEMGTVLAEYKSRCLDLNQNASRNLSYYRKSFCLIGHVVYL
jgi:hypothetical protein